MVINSTVSTNAEELLAKLGSVVGVSELAYKNRGKEVSAPVLVTENAFVFFPCTYEQPV